MSLDSIWGALPHLTSKITQQELHHSTKNVPPKNSLVGWKKSHPDVQSLADMEISSPKNLMHISDLRRNGSSQIMIGWCFRCSNWVPFGCMQYALQPCQATHIPSAGRMARPAPLHHERKRSAPWKWWGWDMANTSCDWARWWTVPLIVWRKFLSAISCQVDHSNHFILQFSGTVNLHPSAVWRSKTALEVVIQNLFDSCAFWFAGMDPQKQRRRQWTNKESMFCTSSKV